MKIDWTQAPQGVHKYGKLGTYDIRLWPATDTDPSFAMVDVPSSRDPDKVYSVTVTRSGTECTCASATYRPWQQCKHRATVEYLLSTLQEKQGI